MNREIWILFNMNLENRQRKNVLQCSVLSKYVNFIVQERQELGEIVAIPAP